MSFISASGLPADVHQQLCNNLVAAAAEGGVGLWGLMSPLFTPGEPPKFASTLSRALRILTCESSTGGVAETLMNKVRKGSFVLFSLVQIL